MVINAALGFDSYLVMRHGVYEPKIQEPKAMTCPAGFKSVDGRKLGCYFCTDIVAPGNVRIFFIILKYLYNIPNICFSL